MGVVCVYAYGSKLQEIVLMNLYYGVFSQVVRLLYAVGMVVNLALQLVPVLEIAETYQPQVFGRELAQRPEETTRQSVRSDGRLIVVNVYDPSERTGKQTLYRLLNSTGVVMCLLVLTCLI